MKGNQLKKTKTTEGNVPPNNGEMLESKTTPIDEEKINSNYIK